MVRMADQKASRAAGDVLTSIGLGSCIGLALVDPRRGVAGLAHILLPDSRESTGAGVTGKFADTAVPALLGLVTSLGASRSGLRAVLVGGAQMFSFGGKGSLDIGGRNERATRDALGRLGIAVTAAATSGSKGRTIRVYVGDGRVTAKEAGGTEVSLLGEPVLAGAR
jgi:chemotaxis protein CheD